MRIRFLLLAAALGLLALAARASANVTVTLKDGSVLHGLLQDVQPDALLLGEDDGQSHSIPLGLVATVLSAQGQLVYQAPPGAGQATPTPEPTPLPLGVRVPAPAAPANVPASAAAAPANDPFAAANASAAVTGAPRAPANAPAVQAASSATNASTLPTGPVTATGRSAAPAPGAVVVPPTGSSPEPSFPPLAAALAQGQRRSAAARAAWGRGLQWLGGTLMVGGVALTFDAVSQAGGPAENVTGTWAAAAVGAGLLHLFAGSALLPEDGPPGALLRLDGRRQLSLGLPALVPGRPGAPRLRLLSAAF